MKKRVAVFLAEGFEEIETITVVDILRRGGIDVVTAGLIPNPIKGSRGVSIMADVSLDAISAEDFDMAVLPGGLPGATHLENDSRVIRFIQEMNQKGKYLAAICAAPQVLKRAGVLKNKNLTSHPSVSDRFPDAHYHEDRVVVDDRLITSRSPGTAMEFAFQIVEELLGEAIAGVVNKGVLAKL